MRKRTQMPKRQPFQHLERKALIVNNRKGRSKWMQPDCLPRSSQGCRPPDRESTA